jgi:hypothetical protein
MTLSPGHRVFFFKKASWRNVRSIAVSEFFGFTITR